MTPLVVSYITPHRSCYPEKTTNVFLMVRLKYHYSLIVVLYRRQNFTRLRGVLQDSVYILNQTPLDGTLYLVYKIHGSGNQGVEAGMAVLFITVSDPLEEFVHPIPTVLGFVGSEVLVPKERKLPPKTKARI